jgi:DUF35 OB-fold domain, acyl-CoA-associated
MWSPVSGRGTIDSYEIVVRAIQPDFRGWAPYPVVVIELDEQRGAAGRRRRPAENGVRSLSGHGGSLADGWSLAEEVVQERIALCFHE